MNFRLLEELDDDIYVFSEAANVKHSLTPEVFDGIAWALIGAFVVRLSGVETIAQKARDLVKKAFRFALSNSLEGESTRDLQTEAESTLEKLKNNELRSQALAEAETAIFIMLRDEGVDDTSAMRIAKKIKECVSASATTDRTR